MAQQTIRWQIFAGIVFSVIGMCLLNYYALFPDADRVAERELDTVVKKDGKSKEEIYVF